MQGPFLRKYGVQTTVDFQLYEIDGVDFKVDAVHASGDTTVMKDEGAEANTANAFTDEGQGYSIVLTAAEVTAARIVVYIVDQATKAWLDTAFVVETYGDASAMHAFDLDVATQDVNVDTIAAAVANKIADHVWRRTSANIAGSSDGDSPIFRSPLGAIRKLVNKLYPSGGDIVITEEDDSTPFGTQAYTTDPGADPITELDTN